jgi:hypothetical protein
MAAVHLGVAFLAADALYVGNRAPEYFDVAQRFLHRLNPRRLKNGN